MGQFKLVAIFILSAFSLLQATERPSFIGCVDTKECSSDECCILGGGRYSSPVCRNLGEVGDPCRPYGTEPFNTTVGYPNGYTVTLTNVYFIMCVCSPGLECDRATSTCQTPKVLTYNSVH